MAKQIKTNQLPVITDLTNAKVIGLDKDGKDAQFPLANLLRSVQGIAIPSTVPTGTRFVGETWLVDTGSYGSTFANFGGQTIPVKVGELFVSNARFVWSAGAWKPQWELTTSGGGGGAKPWEAKVYAADNLASYIGKYWRSSSETLATDIPGTSAKWVEEMSGYISKYNTAYVPSFTLQDGQIVTAAGLLSPSADYEAAYLVPVAGYGTRITVSLGMTYGAAQRVVAHKEDKTVLSVISGPGSDLDKFQFIQPEGCAFISCTNQKSKGKTLSILFELNPQSTQNKGLENISSKVSDTTLPNTIIDGKYINPSTGTEPTDARFEIAYFDVFPFEQIFVTAGRLLGAYSPVVFFDRYNAVLSSHPNNELLKTAISIPENCFKIGVTNYKPVGKTIAVVRQQISFAQASEKQEIENKLKDTSDFMKFYIKASGVPSYNIDNEPVGFIVSGQSNADGRVPIANFPATWTDNGSTYNYAKSLPNVKFNYNDRTGVMVPLNVTGNWAFDAIVYNKVSQYLGAENIYVVKRTRGATSVAFRFSTSFWPVIRDFEKQSGGWVSQLYELEVALRNAIALTPAIKFKAILWHQGEADGSTYNPQYYRDLCRVIYYIRGIVKNPDLPFIFGTIPTNSTEYNVNIYNDMVNIKNNIPNVYMVDLGVQPMLPDGVHFNAVGSEYLGTKVFEILRDNYLLRRKV